MAPASYYVMMPFLVQDDERLTPDCVVLYGHMVRRAGHGGTFVESNKAAAAAIRLSESTIKRSKSLLHKCGYIDVVSRARLGLADVVTLVDVWAKNDATYRKGGSGRPTPVGHSDLPRGQAEPPLDQGELPPVGQGGPLLGQSDLQSRSLSKNATEDNFEEGFASLAELYGQLVEVEVTDALTRRLRRLWVAEPSWLEPGIRANADKDKPLPYLEKVYAACKDEGTWPSWMQSAAPEEDDSARSQMLRRYRELQAASS